MSHSFVLCHETALAQMNISNDSAIPPGFVSDVPTTLAWDNDDFSEETRSGKGTTHITGGIIIQREQSTSTLLQRRDSIPRSRSLPAPSKDINPYFLGKRKTVNLNDAMQNKEIEEEHHILPQIDAKKKDLAFCLCRYLGRSSAIPNWTGFNTRLAVNRNIHTHSKLGYLPVIDASPTELSTVNEILNWWNGRWKEERYLIRFVVRLGDFHMTMAFCGAISKLFKDAGLQDGIVFLISLFFPSRSDQKIMLTL
jgi:hypothetical protein